MKKILLSLSLAVFLTGVSTLQVFAHYPHEGSVYTAQTTTETNANDNLMMRREATSVQKQEQRLNTTTPTGERMERQDAQVGTRVPAERCEKVKLTLSEHAQKFTENQTKRAEHHEKVRILLQNLIDRLTTRGVDTSGLETARTAYETQVQRLQAASEAYAAKLEEVRQLSCTDSVDSLRTAFADLKRLRQALETEQRQSRDILQRTIKPALEKIKSADEARRNTTNTQ